MAGQWTDITSAFLSAAAELDIGELLHDQRYSLDESLTIVELMDPKMDTGLAQHAHSSASSSLEDAIARGLQIDNLPNAALIATFDDILVLLAHWLQGKSLLQSVFTCLYLHKPALILDPALKAYAIAMLKTVGLMRDAVLRANCAEEEDMNLSVIRFGFAEDVTEIRACGMIDEAIELLPKGNGDDGSVAAAVRSRLLFIKSLLQLLSSSSNPQLVQKSRKLSAQCRELIEEIAQSSALALPPIADKELIKGFEPFINSHLIPSLPPRALNPMTRQQGFDVISFELLHIQNALNVVTCSTFDALWDFFVNFSRANPGILARAKLFNLLCPGLKILDRFDVVNLLTQHMIDFNAPFWLLQPSSSPASSSSSSSSSSSNTALILDSFLAKCAQPLLLLFKTLIHNRARQRRKFSKILPELFSLYEEAWTLDSHLVTESPLPYQIGTSEAYFSSWVVRVALDVTVKALLLGFELNLYASHEYFMIYWYIEMRVSWLTTQYKDALSKLEAFINYDTIVEKKKGKGKPKRKFTVSTETCLHSSLYFDCLLLMIRGCLFTTYGCELDGRIQQHSFELSSQETLFNHRFAAFCEFDTSQMASYSRFKSQRDQLMPKTAAHSYTIALKMFVNGRNAIEKALTAPDLPIGMKKELTGMLQVCKTNLMTINLAIKMDEMQLDTKKSVEFDFSILHDIPVFKLR